jgi:hypothetical protein
MSDSIDLARRARKAEGRRMLGGAVVALLVALLIGAGLWLWTDNLGLASAVAGILAVVLPGPGAALARGRRA